MTPELPQKKFKSNFVPFRLCVSSVPFFQFTFMLLKKELADPSYETCKRLLQRPYNGVLPKISCRKQFFAETKHKRISLSLRKTLESKKYGCCQK